MLRVDLEEHLWRRHWPGRSTDLLLGGMVGVTLGMGFIMTVFGQRVAGPLTLALGTLLLIVACVAIRAQRR